MTEDVTVEGVQRLDSTLGRAGREIKDIDLAATGRDVAIGAMRRAPRLTGRLATSIRVRDTDGVISVGTDVVYAWRTEFGKRGIRQKPQPYLVPAFETQHNDALKEAETDAQRALNRVKGA